MLAAAFILLAVYQLYLNQWLQIRWRRWMTRHYLDRWLSAATHYRMQLMGDAADNPDQRIADDIKKFIDGENGAGILPIGIGLLSSVVTLGSFLFILWGLSEAAPISLFGLPIPGYLVWAALIYALVGTLLTHLIGRKLVGLNFMQQRYEADFRFNLVRVRENSEQIGLLEGEKAETDRLLDRFGRVVTNWHGIMTRTKRLTFFTAGYRQVSTVFPYIVVSPAYFSGAVQLGGLMQTASAFGSVQGALSFFITTYSQSGRMGVGDRPARRFRQGGDRCPGRGGDAAGDRVAQRGWQALGRHRRSHRAASRTAIRWSRPTASASRRATAFCSPARRAPASRRCSAPSPAFGRTDRAQSRFLPKPR